MRLLNLRLEPSAKISTCRVKPPVEGGEKPAGGGKKPGKKPAGGGKKKPPAEKPASRPTVVANDEDDFVDLT